MDIFSKFGRYVYALPFGLFGLFHFLNGSQMAAMVPLPGGVFWIYLTGAALLAACVSIIIEKKTQLACVLLGVMLVVFALTIHLPGLLEGQMQPNMTNLLKDFGLAGGAWVLSGNYKSSKSQ